MIALTLEECEWYTPNSILEKVYKVIGDGFQVDLDPCSNEGIPNVRAKHYYTKSDDGLSQIWSGNVFMNPPYGKEISRWIDKLCVNYYSEWVTNAIALVPVKSDTKWWSYLMDYSHVWCGIEGRISFKNPENSKLNKHGTFASALVLLSTNSKIIKNFAKEFNKMGHLYKSYYGNIV